MHGIYHDSTTEGLLNAARANYDDDVVRLAYADCLQEHDDPFGEFVRLCVALPRPGFIGAPHIGSLSPIVPANTYYWGSQQGQAIRRLAEVYGGQWLGPGWHDAAHHRFERGLLVAAGRFPCWDVADFREFWADRLPIIAGVRITITSVNRLRWIANWLAAGFGLVEIAAPGLRTLRPERFAEALVAVESVQVTNLIRIVRSGGAPDEPHDAEWWSRFCPLLYEKTGCAVRSACRIEGLVGGTEQILTIPRTVSPRLKPART